MAFKLPGFYWMWIPWGQTNHKSPLALCVKSSLKTVIEPFQEWEACVSFLRKCSRNFPNKINKSFSPLNEFQLSLIKSVTPWARRYWCCHTDQTKRIICLSQVLQRCFSNKNARDHKRVEDFLFNFLSIFWSLFWSRAPFSTWPRSKLKSRS